MDHIQSRPVGDSFAFGIADQRHALPLIFRDINHALFTWQISRDLCESVRLTRVTVVFCNSDAWRFFYWFREVFFRKKSGSVIGRKLDAANPPAASFRPPVPAVLMPPDTQRSGPFHRIAPHLHNISPEPSSFGYTYYSSTSIKVKRHSSCDVFIISDAINDRSIIRDDHHLKYKTVYALAPPTCANRFSRRAQTGSHTTAHRAVTFIHVMCDEKNGLFLRTARLPDFLKHLLLPGTDDCIKVAREKQASGLFEADRRKPSAKCFPASATTSTGSSNLSLPSQPALNWRKIPPAATPQPYGEPVY